MFFIITSPPLSPVRVVTIWGRRKTWFHPSFSDILQSTRNVIIFNIHEWNTTNLIFNKQILICPTTNQIGCKFRQTVHCEADNCIQIFMKKRHIILFYLWVCTDTLFSKIVRRISFYYKIQKYISFRHKWRTFFFTPYLYT